MRQHDCAWIVGLALSATLWISTPTFASSSSQAGSAAPPVAIAAQPSAADELALQDFLDAVTQYDAARQRISEELPGLTASMTAAELARTTDALARAVQRLRPNARQGDFFKPACAAALKRRIDHTVQEANLTPVLAHIDDEPPHMKQPKVHMPMPFGVQMATMPASLLRVLPPLPESLEYRIVGNYLVLRDANAALVLDYVEIVPR